MRRFNETRNRIQTRLELLNTGRQDSYKDAWTSDDDDDGVLDVDGSSLNDLDSAALSSKKRKGPGFVYF